MRVLLDYPRMSWWLVFESTVDAGLEYEARGVWFLRHSTIIDRRLILLICNKILNKMNLKI